ncbi:MAG TPA: glycosyltransferase family 4 protein, partial [Bacteroidota bacterium]|nr:glycosyltransferase family 4 protein [Bacteroidota bacterium]
AVCKTRSRVEQYLLANHVECLHLPGRSRVSISSLGFVSDLLKTREIDVVHVHYHKDIWIPSIVLRNDRQRKLFLSIYMGVVGKNDFLHRWIYRRVNAIFTSSRALNEILPERYPVLPEKIHLLPYGRKIGSYRRDDAKRKAIRDCYHIRDDEILVGTMVRIDPGKGALDFARSFLYLDPQARSRVKFIIVGEPTRKGRGTPGESPYEPHCEAYLHEIESYIAREQIGDRLLLAGFQDDLVAFLSAMDLFVFPSRDELYSLVVLDAMAMNLPVIAARAGGNLLQVNDGQSGLMYEAGNSADLASRIMHYLQNPDAGPRHAAAARSFVERQHDMKNTIEQLIGFYTAPPC